MVAIHILYCGVWPYEPHFSKLKADLEKRFGDKIVVTGEATKEQTQFFEVSIGGKLVHSKKNGDGLTDTDEKMEKLIHAIEAELKH